MTRAPPIERHPDADAAAEAVTREIVAGIAEAQGARGGCSIVLAGGNTPRGVYRRLVNQPIDWSRVTLLFGDERAVPPDDADSNFRMVKEALLDPLGDSRPTVSRIEGELGAARAVERYRDVVARIERFDIVLLGMGGDGHVASIFPGGETRGQGDVVATTSPVPPTSRVSLTLRRLGMTRALMLLVCGASKAERLAEVRAEIEDQRPQLPAALVAANLSPTARFVWHVDEAAAAKLQRWT